MSPRIGFCPGKPLRWLDAASGAGFVALAVWLFLPLWGALGLLLTAIGFLSSGAKGRRSAGVSVGRAWRASYVV